MREERIRAMDTKLITLVVGKYKLTTAEMMDSGMLERPNPRLLNAEALQ
ncbi:MAG TPA: hypothetical protein VGQ08_12330 [Nitrospiraceae bacterium]|jgi:hypothetical protein|nr:hypothetical protein [Nitrospiraceae bacterium]